MIKLEEIASPEDIKELSYGELKLLCGELRQALLDAVSAHGGHLASNLGIVELTVAIHRVFDTSVDRLVFDVGHQSYIHKMLTGRYADFYTLRKFGGLSGFPKPYESVHDAFIAGHASNSISVGLGMARARTLQGREYSVVSLIGDGALTGGLAYEAMSDAGESKEPLIIILNDNGMSITPNVGGIAKYLSKRRLRPSYINFKRRYRSFMERAPGGKGIYNFTHRIKLILKDAILHCSVFEDMGLQYVGPVDGYDIEQLEKALNWAKSLGEPVVVHVITKKGKGYKFAEVDPGIYHGVGPFDLKKGVQNTGKECFSLVFGETLCSIAEKNKNVCAITAAMTSGTGLEQFARKYKERFFDVSIAEGHATAMSAGLASQGMIPVFAVYSTFLQRGYDMLMHDVGIGGYHVVFAVDRAGLVGEDGETHHGLFDVAYLSQVPGMVILAPASYEELREMVTIAVELVKGPVAIRYPRGGEGRYTSGGVSRSKIIRKGKDFTAVTYGTTVNDVLDAGDALLDEGISCEIVKLDFLSPLDIGNIERSVRKTGRLIVVEEAEKSGCMGEHIIAELARRGIVPETFIMKNLGDRFIPQGTVAELRAMCGIDSESIKKSVLEALKDGKTKT